MATRQRGVNPYLAYASHAGLGELTIKVRKANLGAIDHKPFHNKQGGQTFPDAVIAWTNGEPV